MAKQATPDPGLRNAAALPSNLSSVPTSAYIIGLILLIAVLLLLSGDYGRSWDVEVHEYNGRKAYDLYFGGWDVPNFTHDHDNITYGPAVDVVIKLAQGLTPDQIQKFRIRTVLQALLTLSCLIPVFLISARALPRPLALIAVALVLGTPAFFGHAFINPKDTMAMSGFLWSLWLVLYCFEKDRPSYGVLVALGVLLGVTATIRYLTAYVLLLVPLVIVLAQAASGSSANDRLQLRRLEIPYLGLAILLVVFAITYVLAMPVILISLDPHAVLNVVKMFAHIGWNNDIRYFGGEVSSQRLPWHYLYGYLFAQLPLYYHLFAVTIAVAFVVWGRSTLRTFRAYFGERPTARTTLIVLVVSLVVPLLAILIVRPVLYDGFRHVLFIVPLLCMVLYLGFAILLRQVGKLGRIVLIGLAAAFWVQSVTAMVRLHPYEYVYYNPLVDPHGFELDYWGTSFREVAEQLNDYARKNAPPGEKLRLWTCGPQQALSLYLDPDRFEFVKEGSADLKVLLNRGICLEIGKTPPVISVGRGDLVFAVVVRS